MIKRLRNDNLFIAKEPLYNGAPLTPLMAQADPPRIQKLYKGFWLVSNFVFNQKFNASKSPTFNILTVIGQQSK
jgi:hypothetical protein